MRIYDSAPDRDKPVCVCPRQVLIYPSVDCTMEFASIDTNGEGYLLEKSRIQWYFDHYFQHGEDRRAASPPASGPCGT